MKGIDWEELWREIYDERKKIERRDPGVEYWDKRAEDFSEARKANDYEYGRKVLDVLFRNGVINSDSEVLDIGAGPGSLVIPFAKKVKKVTAVEPSKRMIEMLIRNAEEAGVKNFEVVNKTWEEVDVSKLAGKFDLVICSSVLWVFRDVWKQLERMERASRGYCCIVTGAGSWNGEYRELWRKVMGNVERPSYSEYPLIYNLLYSKGRLPNVSIVTYNFERSVEGEIRHRKFFFEKCIEVTPDIEQIIRDHVLSISKGGKYRKKSRAAVIWWNTKEKREVDEE